MVILTAFLIAQLESKPVILTKIQAKYFAAAYYSRIWNLDSERLFNQIEVLKIHPDFWWTYIKEKPGEIPLELSGLVLESQHALPVASGMSSPQQGLEAAARWRKKLPLSDCSMPCCQKLKRNQDKRKKNGPVKWMPKT